MDICKRLNESFSIVHYTSSTSNDQYKESSVLIEKSLDLFDLKSFDPEQALTFYVFGRAALLNNEHLQRVFIKMI